MSLRNPHYDQVVAAYRAGQTNYDQLTASFPGLTRGQVSGIISRARYLKELPPAQRKRTTPKPTHNQTPSALHAARMGQVIQMRDRLATSERMAGAAASALEAVQQSGGCRFPVGNPGAIGFHFCGARRADSIPYFLGGGPYCERHERLSVQPATGSLRAAEHIPASIARGG